MDPATVKVVPAADKTLKIIEYMAEAGAAGCGVTEIAQALGLNKGTVHPILQTLIVNQWAEKDPLSGKYALSNQLTLLNSKVERDSRLYADFMLVGSELERRCGELINLHYLKGLTQAYLIAKVSSTQHTLRVDLPVGTSIPVIASSAGKSLISELEDPYLLKIFQQCNTRYTHATIQNPETFLQEIHKAREDGYATNNAEYEEGVYSIAAPIRNSMGVIIAAINIVIPDVRYTQERRQELIDLVKGGASRLSSLHGYQAS